MYKHTYILVVALAHEGWRAFVHLVDIFLHVVVHVSDNFEC